jgi:hypothetical protein
MKRDANEVLTPQVRPEHPHVGDVEVRGRSFQREVEMRGRWIGLGAWALTSVLISGASIARAEDVGCCEAECHFEDGSDKGLHSRQRRDLTQAECESRFQGCRTTWAAGGCDVNSEVGFGIGGQVMQDEEE